MDFTPKSSSFGAVLRGLTHLVANAEPCGDRNLHGTTRLDPTRTGNSVRRLTKLVAYMKQLKEINADRRLEDLIPVAANGLFALSP